MTRAPNSPPCSVKESPFLSLKDSKVFLILPIINSVTIHHRRPTYEAKCWSVGLRSSDRKTGVCFSLVTHWVWTRLPSLWGNRGLQGDWAFTAAWGCGTQSGRMGLREQERGCHSESPGMWQVHVWRGWKGKILNREAQTHSKWHREWVQPWGLC